MPVSVVRSETHRRLAAVAAWRYQPCTQIGFGSVSDHSWNGLLQWGQHDISLGGMNRTLAATHELRVGALRRPGRPPRRADPAAPDHPHAHHSVTAAAPVRAAYALRSRESRALRPPLRRCRAVAVLAGPPRRARAVRAGRRRARVRPRDRRRRLHGAVGRADREGAAAGARHPARRGRARRLRRDRPQRRLRRAFADPRPAQRPHALLRGRAARARARRRRVVRRAARVARPPRRSTRTTRPTACSGSRPSRTRSRRSTRRWS